MSENLNNEAEKETSLNSEEAAADMHASAQNENNPETAPGSFYSGGNPELQFVQETTANCLNEIQKVIVGQNVLIENILVSLYTGGHVLLEGLPGVAKTLIVNLVSKVLSADFKRIQFTPDLMPSDVVGTTVFNIKTSEFDFRAGPIFSNIVLIDEINRAPAKTQSSLFEVMEEKQVTVEGETYKMDYPLFIVATQNPIEQEGTYKLPEAQLDRFIFRLKIDFPDLEVEKLILKRFESDFNSKISDTVEAVISKDILRRIQQTIEKVQIKEDLLDYIAQLVCETRHNGDIFLGASPRASLAIVKTAKAVAAINGRDFVTPDDIRRVSSPVLNHRIVLNPEREIEGVETEDVINEIINAVEVPR